MKSMCRVSASVRRQKGSPRPPQMAWQEKGRRASWSTRWPLGARGPSSWLSRGLPEPSRHAPCPPPSPNLSVQPQPCSGELPLCAPEKGLGDTAEEETGLVSEPLHRGSVGKGEPHPGLALAVHPGATSLLPSVRPPTRRRVLARPGSGAGRWRRLCGLVRTEGTLRGFCKPLLKVKLGKLTSNGR